MAFRPSTISDIVQLGDFISQFCNRLYENANSNNNERKVNRYRTILLRRLEIEDNYSLKETLSIVQERIKQMVLDAELKVARRPSTIVNEQMESLFGSRIEKKVSLTEYGEPIFGKSLSTVPTSHYVNKVIYIDTPFALDSENSDIPHWHDIESFVRKTNSNTINIDLRLSKYISSSIIHGDALYLKEEPFQDLLLFKDKYGNEFPIYEGATGMKSFALIQLLIKNGYINKETLLVLDEPEAHLHPQWIVEYARLIILMHKKIGVKFLISSHSTDMISALRYIAQSEDCTKGLEFYCSRRAQDSTGRFNFRSVGLNIEPIFESFNKSYRIMDKYAFSDYEKREKEEKD